MKVIYYLFTLILVLTSAILQAVGVDTAHLAIQRGQVTLLQQYLDQNPALIGLENKHGKTLLHLAIEERNQAAVKIILDHSPETNHVNQTDWSWRTPLQVAIEMGETSIVNMLLIRQAAVFDPHSARTALHVASCYPNTDIVQLLLERDASENQKQDLNGNTPLHLAAQFGLKNIVQLLLEHGALVDLQNKKGNTPLHYAAYFGHEKVVLILLEHGASVDQRNDSEQTPEDSALNGQKNISVSSRSTINCDYISTIRLLQQWPQILAQRHNAARLAFYEAFHPRLGARSPANVLLHWSAQEILQHLHPSDFAQLTQQAPQPFANWLWSYVKFW